MRNATVWLLVLVGVLLIGAFAVQHQSTRRLAAEIAALRHGVPTNAPQEIERSRPGLKERTVPSNAAILQRLTALEESVAQLARNSEYLMERGQLPLAADKLGDLFAKFTDPTAADRDRLQAMRLLRRNGGLNDDAVMHALNWLQTATNGNIRDDILQSLEGVTNAALRGPLLSIAATDTDPDVREQAVDNLRRYMNDPQVESQLWKMLNDPDEDVRDQAREAIVAGPISPDRVAALQQRVNDPDTSLDERLLAWRALRERNQDAPEASASFAQIAQATQDPIARARIFEQFDEAIDRPTAGDAALLPSLVQGLQDASPLVRERAADALNDFGADPTVQQWLRYVAENDPDPAVRRQAARRLMNNR